jgi:alcohol dehydrogenase class IV
LVDRNQKVFLVTDPGVEKAGLAGKAQAILEGAGASITVFDQVEPNPSAELVEKALKALKETGATMVVAVGGGSALDLSKVVAALATNPGTLEEYQWNGRQFEQESLPFVAVPTTSGTGSEVTRVAVIVDRNTKKGVGHDRLFPRVAVVDPGMTVGLPRGLTAATGMDALSHAVEAYVSLGASLLPPN